MEALRASLCESEKKPLVFFPLRHSERWAVTRIDPPPLAWQPNNDARSAELGEIPADVRAALNGQVCTRFSFDPLVLLLIIQNNNTKLQIIENLE